MNRDTNARLNVLALSYLFPNRAQPAYGIFVLNRLKAVRRTCDIKVIAPIQWYPFVHSIRSVFWGSAIAPRDEIDGIEVHHPRFAVIPKFFKWIDAVTYWWSVRGVVRKLRERDGFNFDVIDVQWTYPDIVAGYILARRSGKKFVVTIRGHEALYDTELSLRRWLVAHFIRRADYVVTLSAELRDKVVKLGVAPEKARVILNGVDLSRFHVRSRESCRQQLGLPSHKRIIVSVGRVTKAKGHQDLVQMMPALAKTADVELYIIGGVNPEDDFTRRLSAMVAEFGLKNVHLLDKVAHETLPMWYGAADLFCLASRREGCPNVVLEALACGTPVVVTDVGSVGALVTSGENGFLVDPARLSSLGEIVRSALDRNWDREKISVSMAAWGWSSCAEQVVDVYRSVLARTRERALDTQ